MKMLSRTGERSTDSANGQSRAIRVEHISKRYPGGVEALRDVSLEVPKGELAIVTGTSGSGKSTLMRIINGIERHDEGAVSVLGYNFGRMGLRQRRAVIRENASLALQDPLLDRSLSVFHNAILPAGAKRREVDTTKLASAAINFGLQDVMLKEAAKLSGGEQIRASLLRAVALDNPLVLADEPTNHLDSANKLAVFDAIYKTVHDLGATALVVTHDTEPARQIADREFVMHDGQLVDVVSYER